MKSWLSTAAQLTAVLMLCAFISLVKEDLPEGYSPHHQEVTQ